MVVFATSCIPGCEVETPFIPFGPVGQWWHEQWLPTKRPMRNIPPEARVVFHVQCTQGARPVVAAFAGCATVGGGGGAAAAAAAATAAAWACPCSVRAPSHPPPCRQWFMQHFLFMMSTPPPLTFCTSVPVYLPSRTRPLCQVEHGTSLHPSPWRLWPSLFVTNGAMWCPASTCCDCGRIATMW